MEETNAVNEQEKQREEERKSREEVKECFRKALEDTHGEMENAEREAEEEVQDLRRRRKEEEQDKEDDAPVERNFEADRVAAEARRHTERMKMENDAFARELGYADFEEMKQCESAAKGGQRDAPYMSENTLIAKEIPEVRYRVSGNDLVEATKELQEHFPDVDIQRDVCESPYAEEIIAAMGAGVPMYRAYAAYAVDAIADRRTQAATRAVMQAQSKKHLKKTAGVGGAAGSVMPKEVMESYRQFNPKATDAEIIAHWRNNNK